MRHVTLKNPELSEDEKKQVLEKRAKERYGTTVDSKKGGFILSDGTMLDFSGGKPHRTVDHHTIGGLYYDPHTESKDVPIAAHEDSLVDFMKSTGAIRMHGGTSGEWLDVEVNTTKKPTDAQWNTIKREFKEIEARGKDHDLGYDVYTPEGSRVAAKWVEGAKLGDIDALRGDIEKL